MYAGAVSGTLRWSRVLALMLFGAAPAQAWQVFVQVTSETTFRGSSETTSATTREDQRARGSRSAAGTVCTDDEECNGWCDGGACVDSPQTRREPVPVQPVTPDPTFYACVNDESCASNYACRQGRCVAAPTCEDDSVCGDELRCRNFQCVKIDPPRPAPGMKCDSAAQCAPGQSCSNGQCLSPPPPPPSSSLWRRGSELYLRGRTVQLREDLALGEGPVIATLAVVRGLPAAALGRALRAHRAALVKVMGDGTDATWPSRFLLELEVLCADSPRLSAR